MANKELCTFLIDYEMRTDVVYRLRWRDPTFWVFTEVIYFLTSCSRSWRNISKLYILASENRWPGRFFWQNAFCFFKLWNSVLLNHFIASPHWFRLFVSLPASLSPRLFLCLLPVPPHFLAFLFIVAECARLCLIPVLLLVLAELRRLPRQIGRKWIERVCDIEDLKSKSQR